MPGGSSPGRGPTITCPSCRTLLRLRPDLELAQGVRLRCSNCGTKFALRRRSASREPSTPEETRVSIPDFTAVSPGSGSGDEGVGPTRPLDPATGSADRPGTQRHGRIFEAGQLVADRYRITRFVARGGMGEVYEAEDTALGQRVALKTVLPEIAADGRSVDRFKREIQLARQVTHRNVCRIYDFGTHQLTGPDDPRYADGQVLFLTMEFLDGESLSQRLRSRGRMSLDEALVFLGQMAAALDAAHAAGVVHRDFKSHNVVVEGEGRDLRVVVTDFGLARRSDGGGIAATMTGDGLLGSPAYMAPEQVEGQTVSAAADIYAFGVVAYEMVTGTLPFRGENPLATAVKRLTENPPPPRSVVSDLDPAVDAAILRCLERSPKNRFARASDFVAVLRGEEDPSLAGQTAVKPVGLPASRKRSRLVVALALVALAVVLNVVMWGRRGREEVEGLPVVESARPAVAVLGFRNQTGDTEVDWLSTAVAEMLGTELSSTEEVRIIPGEQVARSRQELDLSVGEALGEDTLARLRASLGADLAVGGSYTALPSDSGRRVRFDVHVQGTGGGGDETRVHEEGDEDELFGLVTRLGASLLSAMDLEGVDLAARRLTGNATSARAYAEGLELLRSGDAQAARPLFEAAVEVDPRNARIHMALSQAWAHLGYSEKAREAARTAFELARSLPDEEQLEIEALYLETSGQAAEAAAIYDQLWTLRPDDIDYGLKLAASYSASGRSTEALRVTDALRRLPSAAATDPRIDLTEAAAAAALGDFRRQLRAVERAVEKADAQGARALLASARLQEGWARRNLGELAEARAATEESRRLYDELGDEPGVATAELNLASVLVDLAEFDEAEALLRRALETYRALGDLGRVSGALNNLGLIARRRGELAEAEELYEESLSLARELANRGGIAAGLNNLAAIRLVRGELTEALELFGEAQELSSAISDRGGSALALYNRGVALRKLGRLDEAAKSHEQSLAIRRLIGHALGEMASLADLGAVAFDRGELTEADRLFREALEMAQRAGHERFEATALFGLGRLAVVRGQLDEAWELTEQVLELRLARGEPTSVAESRLALARLDLEEGDLPSALKFAEQAAEGFRIVSARTQAGEAEALRAVVLLDLRRLRDAQDAARTAQSLVEGGEFLRSRLEAELGLARVEVASDQMAEAYRTVQRTELAARRAGLTELRYQALLLQGRIDDLQGREATAAEALATVEVEAGEKGFALLARKAALLGRKAR